MAIIEQNWILLTIVTLASLFICWICGSHNKFLLVVLAGAVAALALAVGVVSLNWLDTTTGTLAYGILVIYCPVIWLTIKSTERRQTQTAH